MAKNPCVFVSIMLVNCFMVMFVYCQENISSGANLHNAQNKQALQLVLMISLADHCTFQLFPLDSFTQRTYCYQAHYKAVLLCYTPQDSGEMAIDCSGESIRPIADDPTVSREECTRTLHLNRQIFQMF